MEYVLLFLILAVLVVYPVILIRSAHKGKRWARETLEAMRYLGGDMMTTATWRPPPREPEPPAESEEPEQEEDAGRLVA